MNNKEWKKLLSLNEQSTAVVGGHMGAKGNKVDNPFMGPFTGTPNLVIPLKQQLKDRENKRKEMEDIVGKDNLGIENPVGGYFKEESTNKDAYDEIDTKTKLNIDYNAEMTPENDKVWKWVDTNLEFDDIFKELDNDRYKNDTNKLKKIDLGDIYKEKTKIANKALVNKSDKWQIVPNIADIYGEI